MTLGKNKNGAGAPPLTHSSRLTSVKVKQNHSHSGHSSTTQTCILLYFTLDCTVCTLLATNGNKLNKNKLMEPTVSWNSPTVALGYEEHSNKHSVSTRRAAVSRLSRFYSLIVSPTFSNLFCFVFFRSWMDLHYITSKGFCFTLPFYGRGSITSSILIITYMHMCPTAPIKKKKKRKNN